MEQENQQLWQKLQHDGMNINEPQVEPVNFLLFYFPFLLTTFFQNQNYADDETPPTFADLHTGTEIFAFEQILNEGYDEVTEVFLRSKFQNQNLLREISQRQRSTGTS